MYRTASSTTLGLGIGKGQAAFPHLAEIDPRGSESLR
jgi:hypothetical protein